MTGFTFDAAAALKIAREAEPLPTPPTPPTLPTPGATEGRSVGSVGSVGTHPHLTGTPEVGIDLAHAKADDVRLAEIWEAGEAAHAEAKPDIARELFEERAAIREYDGGQDRAHAEREAAIEVGLKILAAWRREADDLFNPDAWR